MKILVCIKQVPIIEENLELDPEKKWIKDEDIDYRISRFDEYALEEALRIKENSENISVDVISVGPERCKTAITRSLGMGCNEGFHIPSESGFISSHRVAALISEFAGSNYDLIVTGIMSEDAMNCTTGPLIASNLNIPCFVSVIESIYDQSRNIVEVKCELEGGIVQKMEADLPCLMTVQSGKNTPRYPSLSNMLRANKQNIIEVSGDVTDKPDWNNIEKISLPSKSKEVTFIEGNLEEKAQKLIKILKKEGALLGK